MTPRTYAVLGRATGRAVSVCTAEGWRIVDSDSRDGGDVDATIARLRAEGWRDADEVVRG